MSSASQRTTLNSRIHASNARPLHLHIRTFGAWPSTARIPLCIGIEPLLQMASAATAKALQRMRLDPDIVEQSETGVAATPVAGSVPTQRVHLNVVRQAHAANAATRRLVEDVGLAKLEAFTTRFYAKAFEDPKLDAFIRDHSEPQRSALPRGSSRSWAAATCGRPSAARVRCARSRPTVRIS